MANPEKSIANTITKICTMLLIKNDSMPDDLQMGIMIDGIIRHYQNYTIEELYIACELNHYGKYSEKIEHYGKFSIDYLSNCLRTFDEQKRQAILKSKSEMTKQAPLSDQKALGYHHGRAYWTELEKWLREEKTVPLYWDWGKVFQFLLDDGRLADYPKERMIEIFERFKSLGKAEATTGRFSAQTIGKAMDFNSLSSDNTVQHECRKFVVQEYCKKLLNQNN